MTDKQQFEFLSNFVTKHIDPPLQLAFKHANQKQYNSALHVLKLLIFNLDPVTKKKLEHITPQIDKYFKDQNNKKALPGVIQFSESNRQARSDYEQTAGASTYNEVYSEITGEMWSEGGYFNVLGGNFRDLTDGKRR